MARGLVGVGSYDGGPGDLHATCICGSRGLDLERLFTSTLFRIQYCHAFSLTDHENLPRLQLQAPLHRKRGPALA